MWYKGSRYCHAQKKKAKAGIFKETETGRENFGG
jgi:hypothetical protein